MKISDVFRVTTTRPLDALTNVSIAELVQFTQFNPAESITKVVSADQAIRREWRWEIDSSDLEYLDFRSMRVCFKDGSTITLKG